MEHLLILADSYLLYYYSLLFYIFQLLFFLLKENADLNLTSKPLALKSEGI